MNALSCGLSLKSSLQDVFQRIPAGLAPVTSNVSPTAALGPVRWYEVGQTIVFCRLSGGRTVARYNRPRKAMVCPTRRPARRPAFSRLSPLTISRFLPQETFPKLLSGLPSGKAGIGLSMTATTRGIACGHGAADGSGNADGEDAVQRGAVSCVESSRFTPS